MSNLITDKTTAVTPVNTGPVTGVVVPAKPEVLNEAHFKGNEETRIEQMQVLREKIIDENTAGGLPRNPRDIEVVSGLINDVVKTEMDKSKLRLAAKDTATNANNSAMMAEVFKTARKNKNNVGPRTTPTTVPDAVIPTNIVPGMMETNPAQLEIADFVSEKEIIKDIK